MSEKKSFWSQVGSFALSVLANHIFLVMAFICFLMKDYAAAALNTVFAFYFKLDDIRASIQEQEEKRFVFNLSLPKQSETSEEHF